MSIESESNNKRIAKNTIYLYVRMVLSMAVTLYTSRVILDVLGVSDYGIYSVIGGIVILVALVNESMTAATQRFITFELGKGDMKQVSDTFSMSMTAHILVCLFVLFIGETIGLFYVTNYLSIPDGRENAAFWVFQFSLLAVIANIIRIPYNASVIAYEKMSFFALVSIVEVILKLLVVFALLILPGDKLILYAILLWGATSICTYVYKIYCKKQFTTCCYYWMIDKSYFKKLASFFGWNFVGAVSSAGTRQVGNLIVNAFCGTVVNAAYGVANQVNFAINSLSSNFQLAYTPQIVILYSQDKRDDLFRLINRSALLSYYLLLILAIPIYLNIDLVLGIWLKEVPPYAGLFCQWLILFTLIDSLQAPLWKLITATGDIKAYEIWLSAVLFLNIPLSYLGLRLGLPPYIVVVISTLLNLLTAIIRVIHVKIQVGFPVWNYIREVVLRILAVTIIYLFIYSTSRYFFLTSTLLDFILFFVVSCLLLLSLIYLIGVNQHDRSVLTQLVLQRIRKNKR